MVGISRTRVSVLLCAFFGACAVAQTQKPGDRLDRDDELVPAEPTAGPCEIGAPMQTLNQPLGRTDESGALVRDRIAPLASQPVRNDELVVETKNLETNQSGWSFNIPLVGYNQYAVCKVCVYIALEGGRRLMASEGWVRDLSYEQGVRLAARLDGVLFREINELGQFLPSGCQLTLAGGGYAFDVSIAAP